MESFRETGKTPFLEFARENLKIERKWIRESISEFIGCSVILYLLMGASISHMINVNLYPNSPEPSITPILGVIFGLVTVIFITGGSSGAHLNPGVSIGLAVLGEISWYKVPHYIISQITGAYFGTMIGFLLYYSKLNHLVKGKSLIETIDPSYFAPVPKNTSVCLGIIDQMVTTGIVMMVLCSCIDPRNLKMKLYMIAYKLPLLVLGIAVSFGINAGAVINPARDFSPRIFALTIGYPYQSIMQNYAEDGKSLQPWWIVGIIGPILGFASGAYLYVLLIGAHLPEEEESKDGNEIAGAAEDKNKLKEKDESLSIDEIKRFASLPPIDPQSNRNKYTHKIQPKEKYAIRRILSDNELNIKEAKSGPDGLLL